MSTATDPIYTLFLLLGILALLIYIAAEFAVAVLKRIERRQWEADIAQAIRLTEADNTAAQCWAELEFAASVWADIDALNEETP